MSTYWKGNNYNLILIIINCLTKIMYYKLVKITINFIGLIKIIINMVVQYHSFFNSIISNQKTIFTFNFWFLLYYFLGIKRQLFTAFYS